MILYIDKEKWAWRIYSNSGDKCKTRQSCLDKRKKIKLMLSIKEHSGRKQKLSIKHISMKDRYRHFISHEMNVP